LLEDYEDEFYEKTGIRFNIPDLPFSKLHDALITDFVSGTGNYDVMIIGSSWVGEMQNYLEPLDAYIERDNFDIDDYFESLLKYAALNDKGQRVGIPNKSDCMTFYYRTDIIEELGLSDPSTWDWDDFFEAADKIEQSGLVRMPFVTAGVNIQLVKLFFSFYVPTRDLTTPDGRPLFNSPEGVAAVEQIERLFSYSTEGILSLDNNDAAQIFYTGDAAMLFNWPVATKDVADPAFSNVVDKFNATAPPGPGNIGADHRSISALSKHKEASWELVKWLHSKEMTFEIVRYTRQMPGRKSVANSDRIKEYIPAADGVAEAISRAYVMDTHSKEFPNFFKWFVDVGQNLGKYLTGAQTAQETVANMEAKWNEVNAEQIGNVEVIPFSQQ
jgi:ABC-type glycerol-3-phosphate transport system substrate-binding protein